MIYADYNGSAPLCPEVRDYLHKRLDDEDFANPNAHHYLGSKLMMNMENARSQCAKLLGADFNQIFFNSGSTEGISTVFHSLLHNAKDQGKDTFIVSSVEHSAYYNTADFYKTLGFNSIEINVNNDGIIDLNELEASLKENASRLAMVTIMAANNESGIIQPYQEIGKLCQKYKIPYFCDTTQFIGKAPFNFKESNIDFAIASGHKFGALTGTGLLIAKNPEAIKPIIIGGGQEKGLRGGTQHYLGYETLPIALDSACNKYENIEKISEKRLEFEKKLKQDFPDIVIFGENSPRLASTTYLAHPKALGSYVQEELEIAKIYVTTSSACSDKKATVSKVLTAMKVPEELARGAVRISIGLCTKAEAYDKIYQEVKKVYSKILNA